ncbi:hypothetical protein [Rahnella victoriana]|uniref:hypothetical protein n=1 Tax=Rahnella victoriana TaxID=1510570 RepID=UPI001E3D7411|nr:hypothetical protein [Rahnella victoriana]UHM93655.1 hypothetical protein J9880_24705 [Rahnella victoriana]
MIIQGCGEYYLPVYLLGYLKNTYYLILPMRFLRKNMKLSIISLLVLSSIVINANAESVQFSGEKNTSGIASLGSQGETHRGGDISDGVASLGGQGETHRGGDISDGIASLGGQGETHRGGDISDGIASLGGQGETHRGGDIGGGMASLGGSGVSTKITTKSVITTTNHTQPASVDSLVSAMQSSKGYTDHVSKGLQKQISENKRDLKRLGATSQAVGNLHYNGNHNGYAVSVGQYSNETALAGGLQYQIGTHHALTLQTSVDAAQIGGSVGLHGDF